MKSYHLQKKMDRAYHHIMKDKPHSEIQILHISSHIWNTDLKKNRRDIWEQTRIRKRRTRVMG
jgi:hypothetical protein